MENDTLIFKPSLLACFKNYLYFFITVTLLWYFLPFKYYPLVIYKQFTVLHLAFVVTAIIFIYNLIPVLRILSITYELTSEQFFIHQGIFETFTKPVELYRIRNFEIVAPFYLRIFGLAHILVSSSAPFEVNFKIIAVKNSDLIYKKMRDRVEELRAIKNVYQMG